MTSLRRLARRTARPWAACLAAAVALFAGADARAERPWLHEFAPAEQVELGRRILGYLTDEELHWHMNIDHTEPRSFFHGHRAYLMRLESHLAGTGGGRFVPLPKWDPARPIPAGLRVVRSDQRPLENYAVGMPVPAALRGPALTQYRDVPRLFEAMRPYHDALHGRVGGCMADPMTAPAAAVFFCWHATLDDLFGEWAWRTGYQIPESFEDEFPDGAGHVGHGGQGGSGHGDHGVPGQGGGDHGCVCGPNCGCGPGCRCPKRPEPPCPAGGPCPSGGGYLPSVGREPYREGSYRGGSYGGMPYGWGR